MSAQFATDELVTSHDDVALDSTALGDDCDTTGDGAAVGEGTIAGDGAEGGAEEGLIVETVTPDGLVREMAPSLLDGLNVDDGIICIGDGDIKVTTGVEELWSNIGLLLDGEGTPTGLGAGL